MRNFMKKISGQWIRGDVQLTAGKDRKCTFSDAVGNKDKRWKTGIRQDCLIPGQEPGEMVCRESVFHL